MKLKQIIVILAFALYALPVLATCSLDGSYCDPPVGVTPPNGNTAAPVNVGATPQIKIGDLTVGGLTGNKGLLEIDDVTTPLLGLISDNALGGVFSLFSNSLPFFQINKTGLSYFTGGFFGLGTKTPTVQLDVNGQIAIRDSSKGAGKVLTSDATGLATWQAPATVAGRIYVGKTGQLYNGNMGGYAGANAKCSSALPVSTFAGSQMCVASDFSNGIPDPGTDNIWYNTFSYNFTQNLLVGDCGGWKTATAGSGGMTWNTGTGIAVPLACSNSFSLACCK